mmetsp:Transcript_1672/g.2673  ORF Transcript_1672/g.2673 Transcript_1672/m.2673 type:complete len:241 (+) Transcript_1672:119-841(+)
MSTGNSNPSTIPPILIGVIVVLLTSALQNLRQHINTKATKNWQDREIFESNDNIIIDEFVQDEEMLKYLNNPSIWNECRDNSETSVGTRWWDGKSKPQNIWEVLAGKIWSSRSEADGASGFEYWCNILEKDTPLAWHVDRDEQLHNNEDLLRYPTMGAVFYGYPHTFEGGYLETLNADVHKVDPHELPENSPVPRVAAKYNRLVILNVTKWHRVSPVQSGQRYTLAVNVWHGEKPKGLEQ